MGIVLKNNAHTLLSANMSSTDTTIYVSDTSSFPALGVGEYFYCTIESTTGAYEIVKVTQVNSTSFNVTRAQENTIAVPFNIGARVELRVTVQSLEDQIDGNISAAISDTAYDATTWNSDTTHAPSKNAVRDKIEDVISNAAALINDTAYDATTWNSDTTHAPSKNAVRDKIEALGVTTAFSLNNIAALQAQTWASANAPLTVVLDYNYVAGDGGGLFYYDSIDTTSADNGGTIILTSTSGTALRYKRLFDGALKMSWFGFRNGATGAANRVAWNACITAAAGKQIDLPGESVSVTLTSGTSLTSPSAGTWIKGQGKGITNITFTVPDTVFLTAMNLVNGNFKLSDTTLVFSVPASGLATCFQMGSNVIVEDCDLSSTNADATHGGILFSWPTTGAQDHFLLSKSVIHGWNYTLLKTNSSTSTQTDTRIVDCHFYSNITAHCSPNSPTGSWTGFHIRNCTFGDQTGMTAGTSHHVGFASITDFSVIGCEFNGTTNGECVHIEENCTDFAIIGNIMQVTSGNALQGGGIILLDNNVSGSRHSPQRFVIAGNTIRRTGTTDGYGIHLLDVSLTTPLQNGKVIGNVVTGFATDILVNTDVTSVTLDNNTCGNSNDIASATTTNIARITSRYGNVTGTTTITSFGEGPAGLERVLRFAGALTLTHNATSLILEGSANITTAAGDTIHVVSLGSSNWLSLGYKKATGQPVVQIPISSGVSGLGTGVATFLGTPTSAALASALTDETGSGAAVFATSPTLTTPTLGVATATSINKVAVTAPASSATLTIADGKTLTASNTLTLTGTDASSVAFGAGGTVAYQGSSNAFTGTFNRISNTAPNLYLQDTDAAVDEKYLIIDGSAGFRIQLANDALGVFNTALTIARTGASPTSASFGCSVASTGSIKSTSASGGLGYATGAGGAVTQASSRTTGVTLNTICGAITLVSAAGSTTPASFTVTNSAVAATDTIVLSQKSGTDKYTLSVTAVGAGSFEITFNTKSGTTTEQPVFNFAVIKAVTS